jgi:putative PEP-CTERM system TPR-repeat lipoprotein
MAYTPDLIASVARYGALALVWALVACSPANDKDLLASGKKLAESGDLAGAAIQYKTAIQRDPASIQARLSLAELLLRTGDAAGAAIELTRPEMATADPDSVAPLLARAWLESNDYKRVIQNYASKQLKAPEAESALRLQVAKTWIALNDAAKAEAALAAALRAQPDNASALLVQARMLASKKQFAEAVVVVDRVLQAAPSQHEAWHLRGDLYRVGGDGPAAEKAYLKAVELRPNYMPAHAAIISARAAVRDVEGASRQAEAMKKAGPAHPAAVLVEAQMHLLKDDLPKAREGAQRLLRVFPDNPAVLLLAGSVESAMGAVVQASAHFGKALAQNPDLDFARESLAAGEIRLGQYAKGLTTLKPLLTEGNLSTRALSLAGEASIKLGDTAAAEAYFQRAAKLSPNDTRVQTAAVSSRLFGANAEAAMADLRQISSSSPDLYADQALFAAQLRRRDFGAAMATLDSMAKKRPVGGVVQELRGSVHLARSDLPAARKAFEDALKVDPGLFSAMASLVAMDLQEKKLEQAVARLQAEIAARPGNALALRALADIKSRANATTAEVRKLYLDAVAASPLVVENRWSLMEFTLRKRLFKDALSDAQEALAAIPGDTRIMEGAGNAQLQAGDYEQAATTFRRLASALPTSGVPYLRLAEVYKLQGKSDAAENAVNKALELEPGNDRAQTMFVDLMVASNRKKGAQDFVRRQREQRPNQSVVYALEAGFHQRVGDTEAALVALKDGVSRTGDSELAGRYFNLLSQSDKAPEASRFADNWLRQHPKDSSFEFRVAMRDLTTGELKQAESRLKRVVEQDPKHVMALNNLAYILASTGRPEALEYAQQAVDLAPDQPALMDTLARALAANKQLEQALAVQRRAIELAPADANLKLGLAILALKAGDRALAREELLRLQKLGSAFKAQSEVTRLLQTL